MILVTGATGHLGKEVVNGLLQKINPADIAVLIRQEAQAKHFRDLGVNVQIGDYDHIDTLVKAFTGIKQGEFVETSGDLEQLLGRKPSTLNEFITSHYSSN